MHVSAGQRRVVIAQMVKDQEFVNVSDLAERFGVTEVSIRRDLHILELEGKLQRVHGGAVDGGRYLRVPTYQEKMQRHIEEKRRIGVAAAALIKQGDTVIFDSGTTVFQVAINIPRSQATTASLTIVQFIVLGGIYLPDFQATVGPQAIANLRKLQVDKALLGCDGLTPERGLMTTNVLIAELGRVMAEVSNEVIVVADSSKIGHIGFAQITSSDSVQCLITNVNANPDLVSHLRSRGI